MRQALFGDMIIGRSRESRGGFLEKYADTDPLLLLAHSASPTMGRIVSNGLGCKYQLADS